jgi:branched-chain amino acid transport system substrate-binding protein
MTSPSVTAGPKQGRLVLCAFAGILLAAGCSRGPSVQTVPIGLNFELTGDIPMVGASAKNAAQLFFDQLNTEGGIAFPDGVRPAEPILRDNAAKPEQAAEVAQQLILRNEVVAVVGPNSSACSIPAAKVAEGLKTVMISPWSSDPRTTMDPTAGVPKRYVFRACFTDLYQARVMAAFALKNLGAKTAGVLFESGGDPAAAQAEAFRDAFAAGGGTVVASEAYEAGSKDLAAQLNTLRLAAPDVVFLPAYFNEVPAIVREARQVGVLSTFLGTDAWTSPDLARRGGDELQGSYFCNNFASGAPVAEVERFVTAYQAMFGHPPDDVAALTYDACGLVVAALEKAGRSDRESLREALAQLAGFPGAAGTYTFEPGSGEPRKTAAILQVKEGKLNWVTNTEP